jgi:hypothetical protein
MACFHFVTSIFSFYQTLTNVLKKAMNVTLTQPVTTLKDPTIAHVPVENIATTSKVIFQFM